MKMTYTKSQFEMPDGKYLAKFLGTTLREDQPGTAPRLGADGKPLPPAMTWDFEIVEGDQAGKKTDKLTGRVPTPKSGCGKMLAAVSDSILKDGQEIDLTHFVGKLYRVTVLDNRVQDNPPPVRVYDQPPAAPTPPAPPAPPAGPRFWVADPTGGPPVLRTLDEVKAAYGTEPGYSTRMAMSESGGAWGAMDAVIPELKQQIPF